MTDQLGWKLGQTSAHYESGGHGPGEISSGKGDHGGVSYGTYQLSTKSGTLREYLDQSPYEAEFKGLEPATPTFDAHWKELAKTDPNFERDQYKFIKASHYDKEVAQLKADGLDLTDRGPAVQDALWSTSVQYRTLTPGVFRNGLKEKFGQDYKLSDLSDKDIVGAVQDYKVAHNDGLFRRSSEKERESTLDRAKSEKIDLLSLADGKVVHHESHHSHVHVTSHPAVANSLRQGMHGGQVQQLQAQLGELGYLDNTVPPDGKFGPTTRDAVKAYQHDHHLPEVGQAGPATRQAIQADLTPLRQQSSGPLPAVSAMSSLPANPGLDDPRNALNANYSLYNELKTRIPDASEQRLLQFTAACHSNKITPENLGQIHFDRQGGTLMFMTSWPPQPPATVDLKTPPPEQQQSIQQIQQHDQQQAQMMGQTQAQNTQINQQATQGQTPGMPGR